MELWQLDATELARLIRVGQADPGRPGVEPGSGWCLPCSHGRGERKTERGRAAHG